MGGEAEQKRLLKRIEALELENESLRDELKYLKADRRSKETELCTALEAFKTIEQKNLFLVEAAQIGKQIRSRFLEEHRLRRMGLRGTPEGHNLIKIGDRAAHRGRSVIDAVFYETGERNDVNVYTDLYGVSPSFLLRFKDIEEITVACGFHGTLMSDQQMSTEFKELFEKLVEEVEELGTAEKVRGAFGSGKGTQGRLKRNYSQLQDCFDGIVAVDSPRRRGVTSPPTSPGASRWN